MKKKNTSGVKTRNTKPRTQSTDELLSAREVAALRGVTRASVYHWLKNGLPHTHDRFGNVLVERSDAATFTPRSVGNFSRKITEDIIKLILAMRRKKMKIVAIAEELGMAKSSVGNIVRKKKKAGAV